MKKERNIEYIIQKLVEYGVPKSVGTELINMELERGTYGSNWTDKEIANALYNRYIYYGLHEQTANEEQILKLLLALPTISEKTISSILKKFGTETDSTSFFYKYYLTKEMKKLQEVRDSREKLEATIQEQTKKKSETLKVLQSDIKILSERRRQLREGSNYGDCQTCTLFRHNERYITLKQIQDATKEQQEIEIKNKQKTKELTTREKELVKKEKIVERQLGILKQPMEQAINEWLQGPKIRYLKTLRSMLSDTNPFGLYECLMNMIMTMAYKLEGLEDYETIKKKCTKWKKQLPDDYLKPDPVHISKTIFKTYKDIYNRDIDPEIFEQICLINNYNLVDNFIEKTLAEVEEDG